MINNKFLYFKTRAAFDAKKEDIDPNSIVFIEEGRTIYTHKKYYDTADVKDAIDSANGRVDKLITDIDLALKELEASLKTYANDRHDAALRQAREDLQEAQDTIEYLRSELDKLEGDQADAGLDIKRLEGFIASYAEFWDKTNGSVVTLESKLDAIEGIIGTEGSYANIAKNYINQYKEEVDLKIGTLERSLRNIDIDSAIETAVGQSMNAVDGKLELYATKAYADEQATSAALMKFDAQAATISSIASRVEANETAISGLQQQVGPDGTSITEILSSYAKQSDLDEAKADLVDISSRVSVISDALEASVDITAEYINDLLDINSAAKIFASANADGSEIVLSADHIDIQGLISKLDLHGSGGGGTQGGDSGESGGSSEDESGLTLAQQDALAWLIANESKLVNTEAYAYIRPAGVAFSNGSTNITLNLTDGLKHETGGNSSKNGYWLKNDGTGSLANGNISWDANGQVTINGKTIRVDGSDVVTEDNIGDTVINNNKFKTYIEQNIVGLSDEDKQALLDDISSNFSLEGYLMTKDLATTVVDGNGTTIATIKSGLDAVNAWDAEGGKFSTFALKSEVVDKDELEAYAGLKTWAENVQGQGGAGFKLSSLIKALVNDDNIDDGLSAEIIGMVKNGKSSLELTADDITFNGNISVKDKLDAIGDITTASNLIATDSANDSKVTINGSKLEYLKGASTATPYKTIQLNADGSGNIANEKISWTNDGTLTINGNVVRVNGSPALTPENFVGQLNGNDTVTTWLREQIGELSDEDKESIKDYVLENFSLEGYVTSDELNETLRGYVTTEGLRTEVTNINGSITTINNTIDTINGWIEGTDTLFAGFVKNTDITDPNTSIGSKLNTFVTRSDADNTYMSKSGISSWFENYWTGSSAKAAIDTQVTNIDGKIVAESTILAMIDDKAASIKTYVDDAISGIELSADQIDLSGFTTISNIGTYLDVPEHYSAYIQVGENKITMRAGSLNPGLVKIYGILQPDLISMPGNPIYAYKFIADANSTDILLANGNTLPQSSVTVNNRSVDITCGDIDAGDIVAGTITAGNGGISSAGTVTANRFIKDAESTDVLLANGNTIAQSSLGGNGASSLGELSDVELPSTITTGHFLTYTADGKWKPAAARISLENVTDLTASGTITANKFVKNATSNSILLANGTTIGQESFVKNDSLASMEIGKIDAGDIDCGDIIANSITADTFKVAGSDVKVVSENTLSAIESQGITIVNHNSGNGMNVAVQFDEYVASGSTVKHYMLFENGIFFATATGVPTGYTEIKLGTL